MLLSLLSGGSLIDVIVQLLLIMPIILFSLSFHETAHGYVAYKLGDPTAKNLGRLTLNPIKHVDPIGFLAMILVATGLVGMWMAVFADSGVAMLCVLNSIRMLYQKDSKREK